MGRKTRWIKDDAVRLGFVIHEALIRAARSEGGEVDLELDGKWVRIASTKRNGVVMIFEIKPPPEFSGRGKEG